MPAIDFFKYHGLGNDFILIDAIDRAQLLDRPWSRLAAAWCDRHTGIGADGVLLLGPGGTGLGPMIDERGMPLTLASSDVAHADLRMHIFNGDGSEAQMCGNGIRCVAKYMIEHRRWPGHALRVLTRRGVLPITCEIAAGRMRAATVDMGEPILEPRSIPMRGPAGAALADPFVDQPVTLVPRLASEPCRVTAVSMGNPHAVVFVPDVDQIPLDTLGPALEHHPLFPEKANAQFVQITGPSSAKMRTWERGAGATQACGTGACAALVAGVLAGKMARAATISLPGGDLDIRWDEATNHVFMTGPAAEIYRGSVEIR